MLTATVMTGTLLFSPLVDALDPVLYRPLGDLDGSYTVDAPDLTQLARHVAKIVTLPEDLYSVEKDGLEGLTPNGGKIVSTATVDGKMIVTYEDGRQVDFGTAPSEAEEADGVIQCRTDTAEITGTGVTQTGDEIRITAAGTYKISGTWEGRIVISVGELDEVKLILLGLTATCTDDSVLYVESADKVTIKNQKGYCNIIRDADTSVETATDTRGKAAIYARSSLEFSGAGTLVVSSDYKHAIACTKKLTVSNGTIQATAIDCGLKGNNSVAIEGGDITVNCGGDGIKVEDVNSADKGYVEILDGTLTIHAEGNGIDTTRTLDMSGGTVHITTGSAAEGGAKGIKVGCAEVDTAASLSIYGGELTVVSTDHAIDCTGDSTIDGLANITLTTEQKGIQTHGELTVGGGNITVVNSVEGLESKGNMFIDGGNITVYASDDGINVGGTGKNLYVSGGFLDVTTGAGDTDGIDSNGGMEVTGGMILVKGGSSAGNVSGSINVDGTVTITGGTVIALGGICETPAGSASCYTAKFASKSFSAGNYALICDGVTIAEFTLISGYKNGWISSESMTQGSVCSLTRDGSTVSSWTQNQKTQSVM